VTRRLRTCSALLAAAALLLAVAASDFSGARFTASSASPGATVGAAADWVAPALTFVAPADGAFTNAARPVLSGAAGTASGDAATVSARIYAGATATGTPVQTLSAAVSAGAWSTTPATLADGTYTAVATQSDAAGNTATSAPHTFTVDTVAPKVVDVQAANVAGGTAGKLEAGDTLTLTFSEPIDPATILAGWNGSSTPMRLSFANSNNKDTVSLLDSAGGSTLKLGSVALNANFVSAAVTVPATMVASGSSVVITLGTPSPAGALLTASAAAMTWTPVAGPKDRAGNALATTPASAAESGASDRDF
jgi:Big-like domain-containing protein